MFFSAVADSSAYLAWRPRNVLKTTQNPVTLRAGDKTPNFADFS